MCALFPISNSTEREVKTCGELFLRQLQPLAQGADRWNVASPRKLCLGCRLRVWIGKRCLMTFRLAHRIEGPPMGLRRFLGTELKLRDTSFFHAAPLLSRI